MDNPVFISILSPLNRVVVDKHANAARIGEIQQGGQVGSTDDGLTLLFLKPSHARAQQGSADAVANGVQLVFTGRLPDGIKSSQGPSSM